MNHAKTLAGLILTGLLTVGCSGAGTNTATLEDYNNALADAKSSISKAKKVNYEWRDTGKILKKAAEAAKSGNYTKATQLANKAKRQGDMAYAQYLDQRNAGPRM